jgi:hypothetical protein
MVALREPFQPPTGLGVRPVLGRFEMGGAREKRRSSARTPRRCRAIPAAWVHRSNVRPKYPRGELTPEMIQKAMPDLMKSSRCRRGLLDGVGEPLFSL